jgi:ketosteroid isomerase-like protein
MGKREAVLSSPSNFSATRAVSQENVEIVRRVYEQWWAGLERGDPGAVFDAEAVADDSEFVIEGQWFEGRSVWRGREEYVEWFRTWTGEFEDWSLRLERLIDAGHDRVVALTHQSGTGKASGVPVEFKVGVVWELKDGRVIRARNYLSYADALEAAGLRE